MRCRRLLFRAVPISFAVGATLMACGDDGPRSLFDASDASVDVTVDTSSQPPPSPPVDARGQDAAADAPTRPDYDASDEPVVCTTKPCAVQLVAGANYFCALLNDGTVRCWGNNAQGSLGTGEDVDGGTLQIFPPMPVVGVSNATQLSAAELAACVRTAEGKVKCWGGNQQGQLGLAQTDPAVTDRLRHPTPTQVAFDATVDRVDVGDRTVCAIGSDGADVYCWGGNDQLQLARPDGGTLASGGPGLADRQGYALARTAGGLTSVFGITKDGDLVGWGSVSGRATSLGTPTPIVAPIPTLRDVTNIAVGPSHACAIAGGELYCWGTNTKGVLGTGIPDAERFPTRISIVDGANAFPQRLAVSANTSCVRMTDGTIHCCGDDEFGQLGRGGPGAIAPVFGRVTVLDEYAVQVATSLRATCALMQGGKVACWGGNGAGELGQGTSDSDAHPVPVTVVLP